MATTQLDERAYRSPLPKLVTFFRRSRDRWKAKHHSLKRELQRERNQRWAVEKSRQQWRERAEQAEQQKATLERELATAKKRRPSRPMN
jgi:chromosome segregation ATPase